MHRVEAWAFVGAVFVVRAFGGMKKWLKKYWHWVVVTTIFLALVLFRGEMTLVDLVKTESSVWRLHREIKRYDEQIREDSIYVERLKDDEFLEKYAREKHLMHAKGEEIFIIE